MMEVITVEVKARSLETGGIAMWDWMPRAVAPPSLYIIGWVSGSPTQVTEAVA